MTVAGGGEASARLVAHSQELSCLHCILECVPGCLTLRLKPLRASRTSSPCKSSQSYCYNSKKPRIKIMPTSKPTTKICQREQAGKSACWMSP